MPKDTPALAASAPMQQTCQMRGAVAALRTLAVGSVRGVVFVRSFREAGLSLSGRRVALAAAGVRRLHLGVLAGHAPDPARHDTLHGRDRGVRGAAVLDARTRRRLADRGRAGTVLGEGARQAAVPRRSHCREPADRGARGLSQASGAGRELPDADALELPPANAWA